MSSFNATFCSQVTSKLPFYKFEKLPFSHDTLWVGALLFFFFCFCCTLRTLIVSAPPPVKLHHLTCLKPSLTSSESLSSLPVSSRCL